MKRNMCSAMLLTFLFLIAAVPRDVWPQQQQNGTLMVKGHSGQIPVAQMNGRSYVGLEGLARLVNGSLSFEGNQIVLSLPGPSMGASVPPPATQPPESTFSKDFLKAAIEEMSIIREWRSAVVNAVQNGYR